MPKKDRNSHTPRKKVHILVLRMFASIVVLAGFVAPACAEQRVTPELLLQLGRVSDPQPSPDGRQVVFGVTRYDREANKGFRALYALSIRGGKPIRLTDSDANASGGRWRPDGERIGFLFGPADSPQLWEMRPDGTGKKQVTRIEGGIGNQLYSPNGGFISFTRSVKLDQTVAETFADLPKAEARIIDQLMFRHWDSWRDGTYRHLFVAPYSSGEVTGPPIDVMAGERFDTPLRPFGGVEQIDWSPDGTRIAYTCKKLHGNAYATSTNSDVYVYDLRTGQTKNVSQGNPGYDVEPRFSPDGKALLWLSMRTPGYEADRQRLIFLDLETGTQKELAEGFDQNVTHPAWAAKGSKIYFVSGTRATKQIYAVEAGDLASSSDPLPIRPLTIGEHDYTSLEVVPSTQPPVLIGTRMSISIPPEVFRIESESGKETQLTFTNKLAWDRVALGTVAKRMVRTSDGKDMLVWVIYPPGFDPTEKYPALLYCQGGPQIAVSQFFSYRWNFQLMAANGYIVVAPNRRGLPGFGEDWNAQISGDWGGQAMRDYLSAIDALSAEPYVDQKRLGAVGASFGGYSVFWLAGNHEGRFQAFVSHDGVYNLESMYGSTEEIFFVNHDMEGPYWKEPTPRSYRDFSPHRFVANWDTPILIIHGELDFRVPVAESLQAFTAAQLRGIPSRLLYFPKENHWVLAPQNSILWNRVFFRWLDQYLK